MNFSIVIPIYNESENIINLLNEIFDNLAPENNFEIILIDDYSSDNSIKLIKKYIIFRLHYYIALQNKIY